MNGKNEKIWNAEDILISGNTFSNVTTAICLHETFDLASNSIGNIVIGHNTVLAYNTVPMAGNNIPTGYKYAYFGTTPEADATVKGYVSAAQVNDYKDDNTTVVTANADVTYTVIIPTSIDFGKVQKGASPSKYFTVSAKGVFIESGREINVLVDQGSLFISNNGSDQLPLTLSQSSFNFINDDSIVAKVSYGPVQHAGSYKGTMVFNINYTDLK